MTGFSYSNLGYLS